MSKSIIDKLKFFPGTIIYTSGIEGKGIDRILDNIKIVNSRYQLEISDDDIWSNLVNIVSSNFHPQREKDTLSYCKTNWK